MPDPLPAMHASAQFRAARSLGVVLGLGLALAASSGCGGTAPRAQSPPPPPRGPDLPADHHAEVAPTNGASDAARSTVAPGPAPTSSAKALPPLPGSSGGDIIAAPRPPRAAPPAPPVPAGADRLPGPADPDLRAAPGTATEPGTTHGVIIPGPADRADGGTATAPAPRPETAPASTLGSPINPPPTTSGGGDPGAAGSAK